MDTQEAAALMVKMVQLNDDNRLRSQPGVDQSQINLIQQYGGPLDALNFMPDREALLI